MWDGRIGDAGVFQNSTMFKALETHSLNTPADRELPRSNVMSPFVFVADDAFPLKTYIMKPYACRDLNVV